MIGPRHELEELTSFLLECSFLLWDSVLQLHTRQTIQYNTCISTSTSVVVDRLSLCCGGLLLLLTSSSNSSASYFLTSRSRSFVRT